ncbi:hypothetical protein QTN25_009820 [Entamoeba marina]
MQFEISRAWEETQVRTYTNWVNLTLNGAAVVDDISKDFAQGNTLITLFENLSGKKATFSTKNILKQSRFQKADIINNALKFIERDGVKTSVSAENILDGDTKYILGLIWVLIKKYQIDRNVRGHNNTLPLLDWVNSLIENKVSNFSADWNSGVALVQLICALESNALNLDEIKSLSPLDKIGMAQKVALERMNIPIIIDAKDLAAEEPDPNSVMTYVSFFRHYQNALRKYSNLDVIADQVAKAKEEVEMKAKEQMEKKLLAEAEKKAKEEAEQKVKEEAETKAKEDAEQKAKEEAETKAKEEAEQKAKEEAETKAKEEAEKKAKEEAEQKAKEEAETKAKEEAEKKVKEEAEKKVKEEAEKKAKEEAEKKAKEEAEKKAKEEAETKAKEEAEQKAKEEAEQKAKEEAEQKAKEEAEKKVKEEAEQKAKEEAEKKVKEEAEQKAKEEAETKAKEEAEQKAKEEAEQKAKEEAEQKAKEEAEQKAKEEAETKAKEEAEQKAKEEAEKKVKEEAEQKAKEEAETKAKEEAEQKAKEEKHKVLVEEANKKSQETEEQRQKEKESEDPIVRMFGGDEEFSKILKLVEFEEHKVIYENKGNFDNRALNSAIAKHKNVMLCVMTTDGFVMGCFISKTIPNPKKSGQIIMDDGEFFVFASKNAFNVPLEKIQSTHRKSVRLYKDGDMTHFFSVYKAFYINNDGTGVINNNFNEIYKESSGKGSYLFVGNSKPQTFTVKEVIAFEFE